MIDHVAQFIAKHRMIERGTTVVVAVSGGPDSLCLLHILAALREQLGIELHAACLDHMLRGAESTADAEFVRATAQAWGIPAAVETIDVAAYAARDRLNLHDAARRVRYDWLTRLAAQVSARAIAVAHTADDQAETVLMHLLRGAGLEGLAGMQALERSNVPTFQRSSAQSLIRPLLASSRAEVEAYCAQHGLEPRTDSTNFDLAYTRNRIRHELLPLLESYNPRIVEALGRTARISSDAEAVVQTALDVAWPALAHTSPDGISFDGTAWRALDPALQRAALRRAYMLFGGNETLGMEQIEQARALAEAGIGKRMLLSGSLWFEVGYAGTLLLGTPPYNGPQLDSPVTISTPGHVALADGWAIESGTGVCPVPGDRWCVTFDCDTLEPPLLARTRQPGDRIRPHGGRGSRSLQDLFVDAKVPRILRGRWPIIADAGRIIWVAGIRTAENCVASAQTAHAVWIQIVPPQRR